MTGPAVSATDRADTDELPSLPVLAARPAESADPPGEAADPLDSADGPPPASVAVGSALIHPISLLVAALVGGGLAYSFDDSSRLAVIAVAAVQALLIISWVFGTDLPGRIGATILGTGAAAGADAVVTHRHNDFGTLVGVLGLSVLGLFAHQLLRGRWRVRVVESLSGIAVLLVAVVALAAPLALRHQVDGPALTTAVLLCATAALVAGHLLDSIWSPLRFDPAVRRGLPAVVLSVIAGGAVGLSRLRHSIEYTGQRAALLGASIALVTAMFAIAAAFVAARPAGQETPSRLVRLLTPVWGTLFTFALMSPVAYLLCLALRG